MPFAPINGAEMYYELHGPPPGEGPAIVFAHGAGGNHISWWQQVPHFAARFTCLTFDHRGWGRSTDPAGELASRFTDDLEALLDHTGIARATLAAQSMGGLCVLGLALRSPERVDRIILSDTHGFVEDLSIPDWRGSTRPAADPARGFHPACGERMLVEQPLLNFLYWQVTNLNPPLDRERSAALGGTLIGPQGAEAAQLEVPALFIAGDEDIVIPPPVLAATAALIPGARMEYIPRAGHSAQFERASEWNELVDGFIAATSGA